ncbi:hypothetical protein Scep_022858 [Stephania cephalantha]|uniref:Uncharacterized protein n=1 Tax=Stephania cephalantha TaxID=152367 RepID=A0AAP0FJ71_9MAGN
MEFHRLKILVLLSAEQRRTSRPPFACSRPSKQGGAHACSLTTIAGFFAVPPRFICASARARLVFDVLPHSHATSESSRLACGHRVGGSQSAGIVIDIASCLWSPA